MKQTLPKLNLILIAVSFVIIVIGFALMVGAPSGETYNPDIFFPPYNRWTDDLIGGLCIDAFCHFIPR